MGKRILSLDCFFSFDLICSKVPHDTKLSKLDTLRLATSYILHLTQILDNDELSIQTATTTTTTTPSTTIQAPNNFVSLLFFYSKDNLFLFE